MFTTSFRILIGTIHGANIYINGSAVGSLPFKPGSFVRVTGAATPKTIGELAQVIESVPTRRAADTFKWRITA